MTDLIRESAFGQTIRQISGGRLLKYPEELPAFEYKYPIPNTLSRVEGLLPVSANHTGDPEKAETGTSGSTTPSSETLDNKNAFILVIWYSQDDPANPQNWSTGKKFLVAFEICVYTFMVYIGGAIYAPSIPGIMEEFNCSEIVSSLGLALYVLSYGLGALLWSPLASRFMRIPVLGRNFIYIVTFFLFTVLFIPTALIQNLGGLLVLRFLLGWFGAPCLATGAAGFGDMFTFLKIPYCLALWSCAAPAMGPIVAGFSVPVMGWRWSQLELLWLSAPVFVLLFTLLPENSPDNILLRRAARLRKVTGDVNLKSQSELTQEHMSAKEMVVDALIKPWEIDILDPAVLFSTFYVALCYAIFYSFFEVFPLIFPAIYGFSPGLTGLSFLSVSVGVFLTVPVCLLYYGFFVEPGLVKDGAPAPEVWLKPGLIGCFLLPIGLFIVAFTSRSSVHWIVPMIGVSINQSGTYIVMNVIFTYVPNIYPKYAASLFAANAAARSTLAAAAILFGKPLFEGLGIAGGVSLLAGISCLCSVLFFALYYFGPNLRKRSRFAVAM